MSDGTNDVLLSKAWELGEKNSRGSVAAAAKKDEFLEALKKAVGMSDAAAPQASLSAPPADTKAAQGKNSK